MITEPKLMPTPHMEAALSAANSARLNDEVPVGAVLVDYKKNLVLATGCNSVIADCDPTAHAEINVIRAACKAKGTTLLDDCDIYTTLEPCAMCAQAISNARIRRVYYGAYDPKSGGVDHGAMIFRAATCHHKPEVYGGIMEEQCGKILVEFFKAKR